MNTYTILKGGKPMVRVQALTDLAALEQIDAKAVKWAQPGELTAVCEGPVLPKLDRRQQFVLEWLTERFDLEAFWDGQALREKAETLGASEPIDIPEVMKDECGYDHESYEDARAELATKLADYDYQSRMESYERD